MNIKKRHLLSFSTSIVLVGLNLWTALEAEGLLPQFLHDLNLFAPLNVIIAVLLTGSLTSEGLATFSSSKVATYIKSDELQKLQSIEVEKQKLLKKDIFKGDGN